MAEAGLEPVEWTETVDCTGFVTAGSLYRWSPATSPLYYTTSRTFLVNLEYKD